MDSQKTNSPENITWSELRKQTVQANEMQFHKLIILLFRWMKICRERVNVDKIFQLKKVNPCYIAKNHWIEPVTSYLKLVKYLSPNSV